MKTTKIKNIKKKPFKGKVYNLELQSSRLEDDLFWVDQGTGIVSHNCFQKDILNLVYLCRHFNLPEVADYWEQVIKMNEYQKHRFAKLIVDSMFGTVAGKKIAILGYAFKANTGDTRETPALDIVKYLYSEMAEITITDPQALSECERDMKVNHINYVSGPGHHDGLWLNVGIDPDVYESIVDAHAVVICTDWEEYKDLDWQTIYDNMEKPAFVFDGRLILDHDKLREIGFETFCIGR